MFEGIKNLIRKARRQERSSNENDTSEIDMVNLTEEEILRLQKGDEIFTRGWKWCYDNPKDSFEVTHHGRAYTKVTSPKIMYPFTGKFIKLEVRKNRGDTLGVKVMGPRTIFEGCAEIRYEGFPHVIRERRIGESCEFLKSRDMAGLQCVLYKRKC